MTNVLLLNNPSNIEELIKKYQNNETKIICFEVKEHLFLSKSNISHYLMEDYIDNFDKRLIEESALEKTLEWHTQKGIFEFLKIENINLGWLLEQEIYQYLFEIMKNFVGLIRILEKEKPSKIFCSEDQSLMIKSILQNNSAKIFSYPKKEQSNLYSDRVEIPLSLGNRNLTLNTSRDFALKIKKNIEYITNVIFQLKYNKENFSKQESILLMEFDNIFYKTFLKELSSLGINIILFNERKPAVWNFESLKNVKNFNCKILDLDNNNSKINQQISKSENKLQQQLDLMFSNNLLFEKIFSICGFTFWPSIKKYFISTCNKRFKEALRRIILSKDFFEKNKINLFITMYDMGFEERAIISVAQNLGVPGILLQHGIYPQNEYIKQFIPIAGVIPHLELKEAVWGEKIKNYLQDMNIPEKNIILSGSLRHDDYFKKIEKKSSNKILLATNVIIGWDFNGFDTHVHTNYQNNVKEICTIANNIPKKELVVKLHPGKSPIDNIEKVISDVDPKISVFKTGNIANYLYDSEVLISTDWSTVLLEAMILGIPTITFPSDPKGFEDEEIIQSGATVLAKTMDEFNKSLNDILFDKQFREKVIFKGKEFVEKYLINKGTASQFLAKKIKKDYFD